jgi:predicted phage terminase large subunit-like protein
MDAASTRLQHEAQKALARRNYLEFVKYMNPDYRAEWFHEHTAERLQAWARHEIPWLIITFPPRHGKTELASRYLPAWIFGAIRPDARFIASSGDQDLTDDNSVDVRRIMQDERYVELFGEKFTESSGRLRNDMWETAEGGVYRARSTGSGLSGRGSNFFIIDDYFSNQQKADSPAERERLWNWWNSDAKKRLEYPASVLVMATRWHHDDLIGRILQSPEADRFEVIHIPKVNDWQPDEQPDWDPREPGEPLLGPFSRGPNEFFPEEAIPAKYEELGYTIVSREEVAERVLEDYELDKATNARTTSALDQGRPSPRGGSLFKSEWFQYYDQSPQSIYDKADSVAISVDAAFKTNKSNDPSCLLVVARIGPKMFVLDNVTKRMAFPDLTDAVFSLLDRWPKAKIVVEDKAAGQSLIQALRTKFGRVIAFNPDKYGNKEQRAEYAADFYAGASVYHPRQQHARWLEAFELELTQFPQATHDDQVDALAQLCVLWHSKGDARERLRKAIRGITGL